MGFEVEIPFDEWESAGRLYRYVDEDERKTIGRLRLVGDGRRRHWLATDNVRAMILPGGPDPGVYAVGVSASLVDFVLSVHRGGSEPRLVVTDEPDDEQVGVVTDRGAMWTRDPRFGYPDIVATVAPDEDLMASARIEARLFTDAVGVARFVDEGDRSEDATQCWLVIDDGAFRIEIRREVCGPTRVELGATDVRGGVIVRVDPHLLYSLLECFPPTEEVELRIPRFEETPLAIRGGELTALLMVRPSPRNLFRSEVAHRVETVIEEIFGELAVEGAAYRYTLTRRWTTVEARLDFDRSTPALEVSAVIVDGIDGSVEVLRELNDINAHLSFARVAWIDGQIVAKAELVAETLDADELREAVRRIYALAQDVIPTMAQVLGGRLVEDPAAERIRRYRETIITAEVVPGDVVPLNGPDAPTDWPFPGPVHVITGWNPQGVPLSDRANAEKNQAIARAVLEQGGRFVHGAGTSVVSDYSEESLVAWGLDRALAVDIGDWADQDAIFEVDADEVRLLSCVDGSVDAWPRLAPPGG